MDPIAVAAGWGFAVALLPGPFQAYLINSTLNFGWRKSIALVCIPLVMDIPAILLTVVFLGQLSPNVIRIIQILGGLYVAKMAYDAWRQFRAGATIGDTKNADSQQVVRRGLIMSFLNPNLYIFWGTVSGPLLLQEMNRSLLYGGAFLIVFHGVLVLTDIVLVAVFSSMRRLDSRLSSLLIAGTIVLLGAFSVSLLLQGLQA